MYLPNYGVFDEDRYFAAGSECPVYTISGTPVGVNICEDIWYATGPAVVQRAAGAELIVNINGSPFHMGKRAFREKMLATRAADNGVFVAYINLVGGQDELVFDGASVIFGPDGEIVAEAAQFEEQLLVADLEVEAVFRSRLRDPRTRQERAADLAHIGSPVKIHISNHADTQDKPSNPTHPVHPVKPYNETAEVYQALTLGTRDYLRKCGFEKALIAPLRRHRLNPCRRNRRRRARQRKRRRNCHALPLLIRRQRPGRRRARRQPRASNSGRCP